jgi:hypothetical protein
MEPTSSSLNRLVSLTFDENPKVRKEAAKSLGALDDPAALFALVELSYDKDVSVKKIAQDILDLKKHTEKEVMSFAEIFATDKKEETHLGGNAANDKKNRVLAPITSLFERKLGKATADRVKAKMMPAIEKIYQKSVSGSGSADKVVTEEHGRKAMQEFLTSYLEAVSDVSKSAQAERDSEESDASEIMEMPDAAGSPKIPNDPDGGVSTFEVQEHLAGELGTIGSKDKHIELVSKELEEIEEAEREEIQEAAVLEKRMPDNMFRKAYEAMMLSEGDDEIMHREMERMLKNLKHDVKLAYTLARRKFKETNLTHLTKLKNGMRNVNTEDLIVKSIENKEYAKSKKLKEVYTRMLVNDVEGSEGVVYLFEGRGAVVQIGMKIRIVKGFAKTFDFSGETALTISQKGNIYIVL